MSDYKTPGVYIEEKSVLPASVAAVETAIPAFIGHTEKADKDGVEDKLLGEPTRITSMLEYKEHFGGPNHEDIQVTVTDTYDGDPAELAEREIEIDHPSSVSPYKMFYALQMYFSNGGGPCYIVSVDNYENSVSPGDATTPKSLIGGITILEKYDEPTLIVFPDHMSISDYKEVYDAALKQCGELKDRFVIMDIKEQDSSGDPLADAKDFRNNGIGNGNLKYGDV
jgi:phage tail sheath protein FI